MKKKRILLIVLMTLICVGAMSTTGSASWKTSGGKTRYYTGTKKYVKSSWKKVKGKWYYFDSKGYLKTGRFKVGKDYYYVKKSTGKVCNKKVGSYYYGPDGKMVKRAWKKCGKYTWYFGYNGKMKTGRFKLGKNYYYCSKSTGLVTKKKIGRYYYRSKDGIGVTNCWVGNYYYGSDGKSKIGKFTIEDKTYCCKEKGGKVKNCWYNKNYYDENGVMAKNRWINGSYVNSEGKITKGNKNPLNPPTAYEIKLLAAITYLEAGNQSYRGKVAVASVVVNRLQSSRFPNTLHGVIYQSGQFVPAMTGALDMLMNSGRSIQKECVRAAKEVLTEGSKLKGYYFFDQGGIGLQIGAHFFH
ncbi:MAG: cell wall hydrolase [Marvinbryantia sp.]|jgi:glucan-binding YG repeat protein